MIALRYALLVISISLPTSVDAADSKEDSIEKEGAPLAAENKEKESAAVKGVTLKLSTPKRQYATGEDVVAELTLTNGSKQEWFFDRWHDNVDKIGQMNNVRFVVLGAKSQPVNYIHPEQIQRLALSFRRRRIKPGESLEQLKKFKDQRVVIQGRRTEGTPYIPPVDSDEQIPGPPENLDGEPAVRMRGRGFEVHKIRLATKLPPGGANRDAVSAAIKRLENQHRPGHESPSGSPIPVRHTVFSLFKMEFAPTVPPDAAISKEKAVQLALDWCKEKWPTTEVTRSSTLLGRCKDKLVWPVNCTLGHPEIAGFSATVYIDAANGKLLGVHVPKMRVR